ncbi:zinc carboxypeptidase family protein (macronuclear) [Tetrahymena thermophila SB210]|uniref:Zinc carboxypeptidase family protein n=1 Tax=Tetrahymena thermophila (strain SB210) TaxID=312017 RepID=W7XBE9_TETTS|nr:zinc carboxypeptidase family protein [Tetrahymena thermophila SB210]EWS76710.1 zinc carboxypeptidase family protein [Tetrahymena thermophila SB210]|eukprot:XP_012650742.1 zinc carboxypeptidase family protein [Tetrahymena thermophila SB210]
MDKIIAQNLKCEKHQGKYLQFIQVNDLLHQSNSDKPLFYCSSCFNHDIQFKAINYLMIDQIIQEADNSIIPKWPPVNNQEIILNLIDLTQNQSKQDYIIQITDFFDQFKQEFIAKIDIMQKKMINETLKLPFDKEQIIKKYQEISNILQFKQLLNNEKANSMQQHSFLCKEFITQMESQKDKNTELLQNLVTQANLLQTNLNFDYPNIIKKQLFTLIDHISFFNHDIENTMQHQNNANVQMSNFNNQNNSEQFKLSSDFLIKLISNKSNFCSEQFINELNQKLQTINPILQQFKFGSVFKENKEPIDFYKISNQQLYQIEDYIKHLIYLQQDQQYENQVKNSLEIKQINLIMNSKMNFLKTEFTQQFENFLIHVKPFLKLVNLAECFQDQNNFDFVRNLQDEKIKKLFSINLLNQNLQLIQTHFNSGQINSKVKQKENGEYEIKILNHQCLNFISNINLEKDLKYIFRIKVQNIYDENDIMIGLMRFANQDQNQGYNQKLSCHLRNINQTFVKDQCWGIDQQLKGNGDFKINTRNIIELRVCLRDQILEIVDYPNYKYKLALSDQYKPQLTQYDDLRLYLGTYYKGTKIILKDAKIVHDFKN